MIRFIALGATLLSASAPHTETRELISTSHINTESTIREWNINGHNSLISGMINTQLRSIDDIYNSNVFQNIEKKLQQHQADALTRINSNWNLSPEVKMREITKYLLNENENGLLNLENDERTFLKNINTIATANVASKVLETLRDKAFSNGNLEAYERLSNQKYQLQNIIENWKINLGNNKEFEQLSKKINELVQNKDFGKQLHDISKSWDGHIPNLNPDTINTLLKTSGLWKHLFEMSTMNRMMLGIIAGITGTVSGVFIFLLRRMRKFGSSKSIKVFAISLTSIFLITTAALGLMAALGGI